LLAWGGSMELQQMEEEREITIDLFSSRFVSFFFFFISSKEMRVIPQRAADAVE
jgi:uncharacterized DUF497 family protein